MDSKGMCINPMDSIPNLFFQTLSLYAWFCTKYTIKIPVSEGWVKNRNVWFS